VTDRSPGARPVSSRTTNRAAIFRRRSVWTLVAFLTVGSTASGWVWWLVARDPDVPFLGPGGPAEWILYPTAPSNFVRPAADVEADFRRAIVLRARPSSARLRARFHRSGAVIVNGTPVKFPSGSDTDWKRAREAEIAPLLHDGTNQIDVRVRSRFGPPALWLSIDGDGIVWSTDDSWIVGLAGAAWRAARLATTPMDRWPPAPEERGAPASARPRVWDAAEKTLPLWAAFAAATSVLLVGVVRLPTGDLRARCLVALAALAWTLLMWNDARQESDRLFGFDVEGHLKYIAYVLQNVRLPFADEGWEMYQPPLYYALAAGVVRAFGHTAIDYDTLAILRWLNVAGGLVLLGALAASLREMFPDHPARRVTGFTLGAFLPAQLYMAQYVGNETWAAAWAALACWMGLRILRRGSSSVGSALVLGLFLGAALLTKFSALIVVGATVLALAARGDRRVRRVVTVVLACAVVAGWHFVRVGRHFGKPFVGNWDPATGFAWWQDPGYHTVGYYTTFGRSLVEPIFSSYHSFADGVFSTAWGDALLGGSTDRAVRPPLNYDPMTAGYLLACLPTLAILAGVGASLIGLVREPRAEWSLVLGILGGTAFAIFVMTLRLPFHSQAKAFYGLGALVPASLVGARGFDVLAGRSRVVRGLLAVLWGTWALNACASFWVRG